MLLEHTEGVPKVLSPGNEQVRRQENLVKSALVPSQIVDVPLINLNPCFCSRIGEAPDVEFVPIVVHPTYFLAPAGVVDNAQRGFRNQQVIHGFQRLDVVNVFFCQFVKATHCFSRVATPVGCSPRHLTLRCPTLIIKKNSRSDNYRKGLQDRRTDTSGRDLSKGRAILRGVLY